jgi:hypothetical protein
MNFNHIARPLALALSLAAWGAPAFAEPGGDIYTRLHDMKMMDRNKDSMISKQEFLAMVSKLWDMKAEEMKVKSGKLDPEQLRELEKVLGRTLGFQSSN